jgi:F-type H+-transporting ATPase subunit alpha
MEEKIARGRLLRELLKQDRLSPNSSKLQLAWLVAFNDHLLDELGAEEIGAALESLASAVAQTQLGLDDERDLWSRAVAGWLESTTRPADESRR